MESFANKMREPFKIFSSDDLFSRYENVYCCGSRGLLLSSEGQLLLETLDEHIYWTPSTMSSSYIQEDKKFNPIVVKERVASLSLLANELKVVASRNSKIIRLPSSHLYIDLSHPFGWYAFGHLFDSLQRLYSIKDFPSFTTNGKVKFLISRYDRVNDFLLHLSVLLARSISQEDFVELDQNSVYHVPQLIKPSMQSLYTNFTDEVYSWLIDKYVDYFKVSHSYEKKIYLTRNHVKPGRRGVNNEEPLLDRLRSEGFLIVDGKESLSEIVKIFSSAGLVVGPHGSLFANTIFCGPKTKIIEFCPRNRPDVSFLSKTKFAKDYVHLLVDADNLFNIDLTYEDIVIHL